MLCLASLTPRTFVDRFEANLDDMLVDHAHCEKKAASTALNLIFRYPDNPTLVAAMAPIVEEEMLHFRQVLEKIEARGFRFRRMIPSQYAPRIQKHLRGGEGADAFVDRMLLCALIEARSCERFRLLGDHLTDPDLAAFYAGLFASEARHYMTYVRLAAEVAPEDEVRSRLAELAEIEATVAATGEDAPRLHT